MTTYRLTRETPGRRHYSIMAEAVRVAERYARMFPEAEFPLLVTIDNDDETIVWPPHFTLGVDNV